MATPRTEDPSDLISGVLHDARDLALAEVDRLKAEVTQIGQKAKATGIGLGVLVVAFVLLGQALGFAVAAAGLPMWASFGVVGAVFLTVGVVLMKRPPVGNKD